MTASPPGAVRPVPGHLRTVTPRLVVADAAATADFYTKASGAQEIGERFTAGRRADPCRDPDRGPGGDDHRGRRGWAGPAPGSGWAGRSPV